MIDPNQSAFGSLIMFNGQIIRQIPAESIKIEGVQHSLLTNFEMTQTFKHHERSPQDVYYLFPTDLKICIYDLTFVIGKEIVKPELKPKEEAKETYDQAVEEGYTAIYGADFSDGLTEIQLGNIGPNVECKIILKIAFEANLIDDRQFFIKFPLGVYTPNGQIECLTTKNFQFKLIGEKDRIENITSNIGNGHTDLNSMTFFINGNLDGQSSAIITFTSKEPIDSRCLTTSKGPYAYCSLILCPHLRHSKRISSSEFVFLVDCSGSMSGQSIQKAGECLEFFIKSLPADCYFNIIRFGSHFEPLFNSSERYCQENVEKAIDLAQNLTADLGGTELNEPLRYIFDAENPFGQRQVFILTDGEVSDRSSIIELVRNHSNNNRCFTVGLGRSCDGGLVEGIANASGGKCAFVHEGDLISQTIIPQLQSSLQPEFSSIEVHIEGDDSFEISPYPIPSVNPNGSTHLCIRTRNNQSIFDNGILVTGCFGQERIEIPVNAIEPLLTLDEDIYGCSGGRNIGSSIPPLFAFSILRSLEENQNCSSDVKNKAIELSILSGVLCRYTGYVGISRCNSKKPQFSNSRRQLYEENLRIQHLQDLLNSIDSIGSCYLQEAHRVMGEVCLDHTKHEVKSSSSNGFLSPFYNLRNRFTSWIHRHKTDNDSKKKSNTRRLDQNCCPPQEQSPTSQQEQSLTDPQEQSLTDPQEQNLTDPQEQNLTDPQEQNPTSQQEQNPTASKKSNPQAIENNYDLLLSLMRYQSIDGSWCDLQMIRQITGITYDSFDEITVSDPNKKEQCIATIIALATLRAKASEAKDSWILLEAKALSWLHETLPNIDIESIINRIIPTI